MRQFVTKETILPKKTKKNISKIEPKIKQQNIQQTKQQQKKKKLTKKQRIQLKRKNRFQKLKQNKVKVQQNITAAQASTKSMGLFDKKAHKQQRQHKVKRRKQYSNFANIEQQLARNRQIFQIVKRNCVKRPLQYAK